MISALLLFALALTPVAVHYHWWGTVAFLVLAHTGLLVAWAVQRVEGMLQIVCRNQRSMGELQGTQIKEAREQSKLLTTLIRVVGEIRADRLKMEGRKQ